MPTRPNLAPSPIPSASSDAKLNGIGVETHGSQQHGSQDGRVCRARLRMLLSGNARTARPGTHRPTGMGSSANGGLLRAGTLPLRWLDGDADVEPSPAGSGRAG